MMRSVLNEGTGAGARGERLHRRCRRQVGHHQRSARRVVRRLHAGAAHRGLGRPRRQPAARPERRAGGAADLDGVHEERAGRPRRRRRSRRPTGVSFVEIDRDTGKIATPICPRVTNEAFLAGHRAARRSANCTECSSQCRPVARCRDVPGYWLPATGYYLYEPRSLRGAGRSPVPRRRSRARDDRVVERLDAAARRREDARLRRRPHRRHRRRRLLRARRDRQGASRCCRRASRPPSNTISTTTSRKKPGWCAAGRWKCSSSRSKPSPAVYIFGAGHVGFYLGEDGARSRLRRARDRRSRRVREHRALPVRGVGRRRRHSGLARADADSRRRPMR